MSMSEEVKSQEAKERMRKREEHQKALAKENDTVTTALYTMQGLLAHGRQVDRQLVLDAFDAADMFVYEQRRRRAELVAAHQAESVKGAPPHAQSP